MAYAVKQFVEAFTDANNACDIFKYKFLLTHTKKNTTAFARINLQNMLNIFNILLSTETGTVIKYKTLQLLYCYLLVVNNNLYK